MRVLSSCTFIPGAHSHHIIERALRQANGGGNGRTDDICARFSITGVAFGGKSGDFLSHCKKFNRCHYIEIFSIWTLVYG